MAGQLEHLSFQSTKTRKKRGLTGTSKTAQRYIEALRAAGHDAETVHDSSETHSSLVMGFGDAGIEPRSLS